MFIRSRQLLAGAAGILFAVSGGVGLTGTAVADQGSSGGAFDVTLTSSSNLNPGQESVTLPLFRGSHNGQAVFYVVTDDSNESDAARRGVNWGRSWPTPSARQQSNGSASSTRRSGSPESSTSARRGPSRPARRATSSPAAAMRPERSATPPAARSSRLATASCSMPPRSLTLPACTIRW